MLEYKLILHIRQKHREHVIENFQRTKHLLLINNKYVIKIKLKRTSLLMKTKETIA